MKSHANNHEWRFFLSPGEAWAGMYEECARATQSIEMEQYIFENDETGQKFMRLFIEKAKAGIRVSLLLDKVGSATLYFSSLPTDFREAGGLLRFYNSPKFIDIFKPSRFFPRTHVKALIVDSSVFYVGGVCLAQRMEQWRDTQIRITGPVVHTAQEALRRNYSNAVPLLTAPGQNSDNDFIYVQNDPGFFRHPIYKAMIDAICQATEYVFISEALFVPTRKLRRVLRQAIRRGVKVIVLVPEHSDVWIADWAGLSYAAGLLRGGVRIFHYQPIVLHNKLIIVDGTWGTIGSCNMDALSFFHNREANVIVKNEIALAEMKKDFLNDLTRSRELTFELLKEIPLWKRAAAQLAKLARSFL